MQTQQWHKMYTEYNISELFKMHFAYEAKPYPIAIANRVRIGYYGAIPFEEQIIPKRNEISKLGVKLWEKNLVGREFFMPINLEGYLLQNTIISASTQKNIVEKVLVGRKGTVKEMISAEDWVFNVKGIIVSADNNYPEEEVTKLSDLYEINKALKIKNALAAILLKNNEKVVIRSLNLVEVKMENVQAFDMQLVSDNDFEIVIK